MKAVIFPPSDAVRANTVYKSAIPPLVIQIFSPFSVQLPSAFFTACVRIEAASEPAPDSVRQKAAIISPLASLGRYLAFCSWLPAMRSGSDPSMLPAIDVFTPEQP